MFTGIVTAIGTVLEREDAADGVRFVISASYDGLETGESIAVNGACLTVETHGPGWFSVRAVRTTLDRTTFGGLETGQTVNLERALRMGDRLGGHWVQGHVDGVGRVLEVTRRDDAVLIDLEVPPEVAATTIDKGSITVDGVSLTVNRLDEGGVIQVSLIPLTLEQTTLGQLERDHAVHVEADVLGKYVRRLMQEPSELDHGI